MYCLSSLAAVLAVGQTVFASPISTANSVFEKTSVFDTKSVPPKGWVKGEDVVLDKEAMAIQLRIHLVQNHTDFHDLAMKVCFPNPRRSRSWASMSGNLA